jgi:hypothetical protein
MNEYTVIYQEPGVPFSQMYHCHADNEAHAEAQCLDANPGAEILWVNDGRTSTTFRI